MTEPTYFIPLRDAIPFWPADRFALGEGESFLDRVGLAEFEIDETISQTTLRMTVAALDEAVLSMPGLEGFELVFGSNGTNTELAVEVDFQSPFELRLIDASLRLRFPTSIFRRVRPRAGGGYEEDRDASGALAPYEITLAGSVRVDADGDFSLEFPAGAPAIQLTPVMIADSGVVIESPGISFCFSRKQEPPHESLPAGWRGIFIQQARLHLPAMAGLPSEVGFEDCAIGSGGFSGDVQLSWLAPGQTPPSVSLGGLSFVLKTLELSFAQSVPVAAALGGALTLPFFDAPVDVEVGLGLGGAMHLKLARADGLASISTSAFDLQIDSLRLALQDSLLTTTLSGRLTPSYGELDWPTFELKELSIDSHGNVQLEGGLLDLRQQYSLSFHGFQLEITKLGFGTAQDGGRWIGCSGGIKFVDQLSAGTSVEGLRLSWYDDGSTGISFEGVGVEFAVPDVVSFKGFVSYAEPAPGDHRFDGAIKLALPALDLEVDGKLVIGRRQGSPYFAIYLGAELPAGIPLGATGLAIYGMAGLFASQMEPNKLPTESWYDGWYKTRAGGNVANLTAWDYQPGSLALGAGVTLGTVSDNGYAFSGKLLLVLVFPGPILLLEGKANLLKERAKLSQEPAFRALAVLDRRAGSALFALDASYKYDSGGKLIDIRGGAEAFFSWNDPSQWHLYLGKQEPRDQRIRAKIFKLFNAESYLMLDAHQLRLGARAGYEKRWKFGPLRVGLEAWAEGKAGLSWKPAQFSGELWLHGMAELKVYGYGTSLTVDARLAAEVFNPYHIVGEFSVGINLPWPLPDFDVDISLEWGPEPVRPPVPLPLQEVAIEHLKVTTAWPLPRNTLLLPNYDGNRDGFWESPSGPSEPASFGALPIVPLDARPHLTFGRPVHDSALVGVNPQPPEPAWERIGDPAKNEGPLQARYSLLEVALSRRSASSWELLARTPEQAGTPRLYGSWAPVPALGGGSGGETAAQVKLWLWSKTPFDYTQHSGSAWDEWFVEAFDDYACLPPPSEEQICCHFDQLLYHDEPISSPWGCGEHGLRLAWFGSKAEQRPAPLPEPAASLYFRDTLTHGARGELIITLEHPASKLTVALGPIKGDSYTITGFNDQGQQVYQETRPSDAAPSIVVERPNLLRVSILHHILWITGICATRGLSAEEQAARDAMVAHMQDELARWSQADNVLEPHTIYQLKIVTRVELRGEGMLAGYVETKTQTEHAYFRTGGPPGLGSYSTPAGQQGEFASGLESLQPYVLATMPETASEGGRQTMVRPVYRAYDVGVTFNENYVDLMYRMSRRDLGLYLYDQNNRPVRDAQGRLIALPTRWELAEQLTLSASEQRWVTLLTDEGCISFPSETIVHDSALAQRPGHVLEPQSVYEARLVPLLLHEAFADLPVGSWASGTGGTLGQWQIADQAGASGGPSRWEIQSTGSPASFFVTQTTAIGGAALPARPGTLLLYQGGSTLPPGDQPAQWRDYRVSALLRASLDGALGLVVRYQSASSFYRFSLHRQSATRQLLRVQGGSATVLAQDSFAYQPNRDYLVTIEAIGASLRVYQDGALVFALQDAAIASGRAGLYCASNAGARFADVRVDDLRAQAPVVYRYQFTTSQYASFFHQLHSFRDESWLVRLAPSEPPAGELGQLIAASVTPTTAPPNEAEARAYERLAAYVLGTADARTAPELQITRFEQNDGVLGLLLRSPEPIDWRRATPLLTRSELILPRGSAPEGVKLTGVTWAWTQPNEERVAIVLQQDLALTGWRVEYRSRAEAGYPLAGEGQPWHEFYRFGPEARLTGGTRITIHSGSAGAAPPAEPNVLQRFAAAPGEQGAIRLDPAGVELRLLDADGRERHRREVLPDQAYNKAVKAKLLRKADGTGVCFVATSFPAGSYRLRLSYTRAGSGALPTLSQAGDSSPEQVVLDIPWDPISTDDRGDDTF